VPEVAAIFIVFFGIAVLWIDIAAVRMVLRNARAPMVVGCVPPRDLPIEDRLSNAASEISAMLDLRACWFEPFPFDVQMPRIEQGRIVLPPPEPGLAPWSDTGVELPVLANGLNVGRFVLEPSSASVGAVFSPSARERAVAMAGELGGHVAAVLVSGDPSRLHDSRRVYR
jgi:hypothetical protein